MQRGASELAGYRGEGEVSSGQGGIALRVVGLAALVLVGLFVWSELPALRRYIKIERM